MWDGGTNPTNYSTGNPTPPVGDSTTILWVTDMFTVPLDQFAGEETWKTAVLQRQSIDPTGPMGNRSVLKFAKECQGTLSHHFQTGLVIPSGNDLKGAVASSSLGSAGVTVHLGGLLH